MLRGHYMPHNAGTRTPKSAVFVDTESNTLTLPGETPTQVNTFRLAVACHCALRHGVVQSIEWARFATASEFWLWLFGLTSARTPTWLYAHNLAYDLTQLGFWSLLELGGLSLKDPRPPQPARDGSGRAMKPRRGFAVLEDPPTIVRCFTGSGHVVNMADTFNYAKCSLAEMGEAIGLAKFTMPERSAPDDQWYVYCERDVAIIQGAMCEMMADWHSGDMGCWKSTAGGLAMTHFRHTFLPRTRQIRIDPDGTPRQLARAAYYGGEVACWFRGRVKPDAGSNSGHCHAVKNGWTHRGSVYHLDVQSAYPAVMASHRFPYELIDVIRLCDLSRAAKLMLRYEGAAVVTVESPDTSYPRRREGETRHAYGRFVTALCGAELKLALSRGHVQEIHAMSVYACDYLFADYMAYWWKMRHDAMIQGVRFGEVQAKLMMNALYGKFGQLSPRWMDVPDKLSPAPWGPFFEHNPDTEAMEEYRSVAWNAQRHVGTSEHPESMPIIAACVTAALRVYMRMLRDVAGPADVLYQDTDSLHVTETGFARLDGAGRVGQDRMGSLRVVEIIDRAEYRGPRNYTANGRDVVSGLKPSAELLAGSTYSQHQWQRAADIVSSRPDGTVRVTQRTFTVPGSTDDVDPGSGGRWDYPLLNDCTVDESIASLLRDADASSCSP